MNKSIDSKTKKKEVTNVEKIENVEGLRKEYPELVQEIETEAKKDLLTEDEVAGKVATAEGVKDTEFETKLETAVEEAKEQGKKEGKLEAFREVIGEIADKDDVVPEVDPNADSPTNDPPVKDEKELKELQKKLDESEKAKVALEKEKTDREAEDAKIKLQKEMKTELDTILEKEEKYKSYKSLIEERLFVNDEVKSESVDKVKEAVKTVFEELSAIAVKLKKSEIVADTKPRGHIPDPEGDELKAALETKKKLYSEAIAGGYTKTYEVYMKEEYPKTHKQD